ncbi:MAG: UbiA family prenyltransferase [Chloroflexi bacterium]|nr:UbiA family prenyltransferase [Chloroflexota bacterium]
MMVIRLEYLRSKLFAYLEAIRPYTLFHPGTLALAAGAVASGGHLSLERGALLWLTPTVGWIAGLATSDYADRALDRLEKPHRPIPSGRIGEREAFWWMIMTILTGLILALLLSWITLLIALVVLVLGIGYARFFKARGVWGHLDRGVLAALTVAFGSFAATERLPLVIVPLLIVFFLHDTFTNLLGAIRDIEGDHAAGYRTLPVQVGLPWALTVACNLLLGWGFVLIVTVRTMTWTWLAIVLALFAFMLAASAFAVAAWSSSHQQSERLGEVSLRRRLALRAHKLLVVERLLLSSAFLATSVPVGISLLIAISTVSLTLLAQQFLRDRYEFASADNWVERTDGPFGAEEERHGPTGAHPRTAGSQGA